MPKLGEIPRLALRESKAAAAVDFPLTEFREMVALGVMPTPRIILGKERWIVEELRASLIKTGSTGGTGFEI